MSTQTTEMTGKNIHNFYKKLLENAEDIRNKVNHLKDTIPTNGLAVARYPSGTPLAVLQKVTKALEGKIGLSGFHYIEMEATHHSAFHLAKNGSADHKKFELTQSRTGGINSKEIEDLGDFLIVQVEEGVIRDGADFSLYKTRDDFPV